MSPDTSALFKKKIKTQKLKKLKRKLLIMIMINIILLKNSDQIRSDNFTGRLAQANLTRKMIFLIL